MRGLKKERSWFIWMVSVLMPVLLVTLSTGCGSVRQDKSVNKLSWDDDLEILEKELPKRHKNLFFRVPKEEYMLELSRIREEAGELPDLKTEIRIRKLIADVGDSHTALSINEKKLFPLTFIHVREGTFLGMAREEDSELIGMKLVSINDMPVERLREEIAGIIPHENEAQVWNNYPGYLAMSRILKGLGLVREDSAMFTFQDSDGTLYTREFHEVPVDGSFTWRKLLGDIVPLPEDEKEVPLYLRNRRASYWMEYLPEEELLYLQYNQCRRDPELPMKEFHTLFEGYLAQKSIRKVVIDLRFNGGGDSRVFQPIIKTLAEARKNGADYALYTVIGRSTFSSAILNAIDLKQKAGAVYVGEPTGGRPNHYGEVKFLELPYSGLRLSYSTKYFNTYEPDTDTLEPDIEVLWSFEDIISMKDSVMERIIGD